MIKSCRLSKAVDRCVIDRSPSINQPSILDASIVDESIVDESIIDASIIDPPIIDGQKLSIDGQKLSMVKSCRWSKAVDRWIKSCRLMSIDDQKQSINLSLIYDSFGVPYSTACGNIKNLNHAHDTWLLLHLKIAS